MSDQKNLSEQKNESEKRCESEHSKSEGKERYTEQRNFYARTSEVKRVLISKRVNIERRTEQYIYQAKKGSQWLVFEPGDWVWLHMRMERFPAQSRSKLLPRGDGPFQVLEWINDACKI